MNLEMKGCIKDKGVITHAAGYLLLDAMNYYDYDYDFNRYLVYEGESLRYEVFVENGINLITLWDYLLNEIRHVSRWQVG